MSLGSLRPLKLFFPALGLFYLVDIFSTVAFGRHVLSPFQVQEIILDLESNSHGLSKF